MEEERIKAEKIEGRILDKIPISILIYNKQKGIIHLNSSFRELLKELKCIDFNDFATKCRIPNTESTLKEDIKKKIEYFNSTEMKLQGIREIVIDYQFKRTKSAVTFSNFMTKEIEIKFYKGREIPRDDILIMVEENQKEAKTWEKKIVDRYKSMISKSICHNLKSPLNGIITPLENISSEYKNNLPIKMIKTSAKLLEYKIEDMIDYSLIGLNEFKPINRPFNVLELLQNLRDIGEGLLDIDNLSIKIDIGRGVPEIFVGDKKRITQIMLHLLQNAIKYTSSGVIIIYVERITMDLEFGVTDVGLGMSTQAQKYLKHFLDNGIMSPLKTHISTDDYDSSLETHNEMGLGLWITKIICQGIGSTLNFISSHNNGSKFFFQLEDKTKAGSLIEPAINESEKRTGEKQRQNIKRRTTTLEYKVIRPISAKNSRILDEKTLDVSTKAKTNSCNTPEEKKQPDFEIKPKSLTVFKKRLSMSDSEDNPDIYIYGSFLHNGLDTLHSKHQQQLAINEHYHSCNYIYIYIYIIAPKEGYKGSRENIRMWESREFDRSVSPRNAMLNYSTSTKKVLNFGIYRSINIGAGNIEIENIVNSDILESAKYKVLVVDDMSVNRLVIKMLLEGLNIKVEEANNGMLAVEMCRNKIMEKNVNIPYDIIFMDIDMPIMNGLQATQEILHLLKTHSKIKNLPIIAVTAYDNDKVKKDAFNVGMMEFALKPLKKDLVVYYLQKYLINFKL